MRVYLTSVWKVPHDFLIKDADGLWVILSLVIGTVKLLSFCPKVIILRLQL